MSIFNKNFKKIDIFGYKLDMNTFGESNKKSNLGAFFTILYCILLLLFSTFYLLNSYSIKNINITKQKNAFNKDNYFLDNNNSFSQFYTSFGFKILLYNNENINSLDVTYEILNKKYNNIKIKCLDINFSIVINNNTNPIDTEIKKDGNGIYYVTFNNNNNNYNYEYFKLNLNTIKLNISIKNNDFFNNNNNCNKFDMANDLNIINKMKLEIYNRKTIITLEENKRIKEYYDKNVISLNYILYKQFYSVIYAYKILENLESVLYIPYEYNTFKIEEATFDYNINDINNFENLSINILEYNTILNNNYYIYISINYPKLQDCLLSLFLIAYMFYILLFNIINPLNNHKFKNYLINYYYEYSSQNTLDIQKTNNLILKNYKTNIKPKTNNLNNNNNNTNKLINLNNIDINSEDNYNKNVNNSSYQCFKQNTKSNNICNIADLNQNQNININNKLKNNKSSNSLKGKKLIIFKNNVEYKDINNITDFNYEDIPNINKEIIHANIDTNTAYSKLNVQKNKNLDIKLSNIDNSKYDNYKKDELFVNKSNKSKFGNLKILKNMHSSNIKQQDISSNEKNSFNINNTDNINNIRIKRKRSEFTSVCIPSLKFKEECALIKNLIISNKHQIHNKYNSIYNNLINNVNKCEIIDISYFNYVLNKYVYFKKSSNYTKFIKALNLINVKFDYSYYLKQNNQFTNFKYLFLDFYQQMSLNYFKKINLNNADLLAYEDINDIDYYDFDYYKKFESNSFFEEMMYYYYNKNRNNQLTKIDNIIINEINPLLKYKID